MPTKARLAMLDRLAPRAWQALKAPRAWQARLAQPASQAQLAQLDPWGLPDQQDLLVR